jgi:FKBP-type peptidyl-prolyl cis-trans isomerase 2
MSAAKTGDTVKVHYTGTLTDGKVFDSSLEREPLQFTIGEKQLIGAFEDAIVDMEAGNKKTINIVAAEAYGERDDKMMQTLDRSLVPAEVEVQVGLRLTAQGPEGQTVAVTVVDYDDKEITLDANHPLAGEDLTFELELVEIVS